MTMMTATQLMDDVMKLPRADRSYLATKIIESLDQGEELSSEWVNELDKRVEKWESGESESISSVDFHAEIKARLSL